jgi:hypothetical protein
MVTSIGADAFCSNVDGFEILMPADFGFTVVTGFASSTAPDAFVLFCRCALSTGGCLRAAMAARSGL